MIVIILFGVVLIWEKEWGIIEYLFVMLVLDSEIMLLKIVVIGFVVWVVILMLVYGVI